eukprot:scaffold30386_cov46-Attheya_sp.AAC.1
MSRRRALLGGWTPCVPHQRVPRDRARIACHLHPHRPWTAVWWRRDQWYFRPRRRPIPVGRGPGPLPSSRQKCPRFVDRQSPAFTHIVGSKGATNSLPLFRRSARQGLGRLFVPRQKCERGGRQRGQRLLRFWRHENGRGGCPTTARRHRLRCTTVQRADTARPRSPCGYCFMLTAMVKSSVREGDTATPALARAEQERKKNQAHDTAAVPASIIELAGSIIDSYR